MRTAGAEQADIVMALTEGDNRNALAAQLAKHRFDVPRVIAKINDPLRGEAYRALGLETICRTIILGDALVTAAVEGAEATNGFVEPPTAQPLRGAPSAGSLATDEAAATVEAEEDACRPRHRSSSPATGAREASRRCTSWSSAAATSATTSPRSSSRPATRWSSSRRIRPARGRSRTSSAAS